MRTPGVEANPGTEVATLAERMTGAGIRSQPAGTSGLARWVSTSATARRAVSRVG